MTVLPIGIRFYRYSRSESYWRAELEPQKLRDFQEQSREFNNLVRCGDERGKYQR